MLRFGGAIDAPEVGPQKTRDFNDECTFDAVH